ncbi:hypothetical protein BLOT_005867 [Blomia tropicalis]|nr:hypothetical protein BLOT_005867 [Blomia tropicalis]
MDELQDFCNSQEKYKTLAQYFEDNFIFSMDDFIDKQKDICFDFTVEFPGITFSEFKKDFITFSEKNASSNLGICSPQLNDQGTVVLDNVALENLIKSHETLKQRVNDLEDYIKNELSKFNHQKERSKVLEEGDFMIQNKWLVKINSLQSTANNSGVGQVTELFDCVFGQTTLRKYKGVIDMPNDLKAAFHELLDHYVDAKLSANGGDRKTILSAAKYKLNKRFHNWNNYSKR